jgi:hypothetical protein
MARIGVSRTHRTRLAEVAEARPASRAHPVAAKVLGLQRTAGNRAARQAVARRPARHTGMRKDKAIERYAAKAVKFWRRNGDLPLKYFAIYLGAAVNEELAAIGVPAVQVKVAKDESGPAAEFYASDWLMVLHPSGFTNREDVHTMGELTPEEAAGVAMTIYHEARHAEQNFRVARLFAAEHKALPFDMEEKAAGAATHAPLKGASALEMSEARDWRTNVAGEDSTYREAVSWWTSEASKAAKLARDVKADDAADVRDRLGRLLHGWSKPGGAEETVRSSLSAAKARKATLVVKDINRITAAFDRADKAFKALPETVTPADFKPLADALLELSKAVYAAYTDQPIETDAWDTGLAVYDAFTKTPAAVP